MNDPGTEHDALYGQAIRLGDAARRHFDGHGQGVSARVGLSPLDRARVAAESLAVTARLMEVVSWFLREQATAAGDGPVTAGSRSTLALDVDATQVPAGLTPEGRRIAEASRKLYRQVQAMSRV